MWFSWLRGQLWGHTARLVTWLAHMHCTGGPLTDLLFVLPHLSARYRSALTVLAKTSHFAG